MTFNLLLEDAKLMANLSSVISSIVAESNFKVSEEGISIKAFDATRISMVDFFMKKEAFNKYEIDDSASVGLSLETLNSILKTAKTTEHLKMSLNDETKRFEVIFLGKNQKRKFALSLIDIHEEGTIPDTIHIDFDANFEVKATFLQQVIKDAEMISDYLRVKANPDGVTFSAESDTKEMDTYIEPLSEEMGTDAYNVVDESESVYSLDFLANFVKGIRSSDVVKISFSQEQPLRIVYEIEDKGHLIYFVAPRIEESEVIDNYDDYESN